MSVRHFSQLGSSIACLLLSAAAMADEAFDRSLSIQPFSHASAVEQQLIPNTEHKVMIGSVRRINNQLRAERDVRATGELLRATWQMHDEYAPEEAFRDALEQLIRLPHTLLYTCEGRECGSSSLWANQVFHNAQP